MLDRASLIAHRQRWQAVAEREMADYRSSSLTERWGQLNALLRLAIHLNIVPQEPDMDEGRQRWQILYAQQQKKTDAPQKLIRLEYQNLAALLEDEGVTAVVEHIQAMTNRETEQP